MTRSDGQKTLHHLMKSCTISDLSRHSKREGTKRSVHHCAFLSMIFPETSIYFADTSLISQLTPVSVRFRLCGTPTAGFLAVLHILKEVAFGNEGRSRAPTCAGKLHESI